MGKQAITDKANATVWTDGMKATIKGNRSGVVLEIFGMEYDASRRAKLLEELQKRHTDMTEWEAKRAAEVKASA